MEKYLVNYSFGYDDFFTFFNSKTSAYDFAYAKISSKDFKENFSFVTIYKFTSNEPVSNECIEQLYYDYVNDTHSFLVLFDYSFNLCNIWGKYH